MPMTAEQEDHPASYRMAGSLMTIFEVLFDSSDAWTRTTLYIDTSILLDGFSTSDTIIGPSSRIYHGLSGKF